MREAKDYLKEYGKPAAWAASGSLAGFAAIDQALQAHTHTTKQKTRKSTNNY